MRSKIVRMVCRLLRHPERRINHADGVTQYRCRCGHIDFTERVFDGPE